MKKQIWDLPTRLFHWTFAGAFLTAFLASRREWFLDYHAVAGAFALGLAAFRVVWGFSGNANARFSGFLKGWSEVKAFLFTLKGPRPAHYAGHNPAVGWVIIVMLCLAALLALTGIIVYSGEEMKGPLAGFFSFEAATAAGAVHELAAWSFVAVVSVHVLAAFLHDIIWKEGLIVSMLTGDKKVEEPVELKAQERPMMKKAAFALFSIVTAGVVLVVMPGSQQADGHAPALLADGEGLRPLERSEVYEEECGSCHNAFSPTLLPARSWEKVMASLGEHFGDDASIPEETADEIRQYLAASSAERAVSEPSKKMLSSLEGKTPLRITESRYWKDKHLDLAPEVYSRKSVASKTNCAACHPGALLGSFEDRDISIPRG